jgi:hypothetical protein
MENDYEYRNDFTGAIADFRVGRIANWGFHRYGYGPSGVLGFIFLLLLVMVLTGRL